MYVWWKDDSVLCGEKIYNNIKIYDFQFISGRNDKEALLFLHIHIWLIHNLENTTLILDYLLHVIYEEENFLQSFGRLEFEIGHVLY